MNAAELLDKVFDVYKKTFIQQLLYAAIVGIISFFLIMLVAVGAAVAFSILYIDDLETAMSGIILGVLAIVLPLYVIWTAAADTGHIILSKQAFYGQSVSLSFKKLPSTIVRVTSVLLAQILLSLPWLLLLGALAYAYVGSVDLSDIDVLLSLLEQMSSGVYIAVSIVLALAFVAYANIFALSVPVAVFEKKTFFGAIVRSARLIKGEFWKILALRLLWSVVVYLFSYSAQGLWAAVAGLAGSFAGPLGGFAGIAGAMLQSLLTILIGFVVGPLGGIFIALVYFNQRVKREGLDIEIELERLHESL